MAWISEGSATHLAGQVRHMRAAVDTLELSPLHEAELWDYLERAAHSLQNSA